MAPALDLVQATPERRVGLAEAAAACSLSPTQFRFVFRQTMGATFGVFTLRARLSHAAQLLAYTDLPLKAIAEQTGFTDHSHLHRAFARVYGCPPGRYREQHQRRAPAVTGFPMGS
jgi:transcriptional regulator GlxA family with amidase domain